MKVSPSKLILSLILCSIILLSSTISANAGIDFKKYDEAVKLWDYCIKEGSCELWAATAVGNAFTESGFNKKAQSGSYQGYFQFSQASIPDYNKFRGSRPDDITAEYDYLLDKYRAGSVKGLTGYTFPELKKNKGNIYNDAYSASAYWALGTEGCICWSGITKGKGSLLSGHSHKEGSCDSYKFKTSYGEVQLQHLRRRETYTKDAFKTFTGRTPANNTSDRGIGSGISNGAGESSGGTSGGNVVSYGNLNGFYNASDLDAFTRLSEADISVTYLKNALRDSLSQSELSGIGNWENNLEEGKLSNRILKLLRTITVFFGIFIIAWSVLIYSGFWFDRTNNIVDLNIVGLLTLGKLHTAIEDRDATFSIHNMDGKNLTIAHKDMLFICLLGVFIGASVISGFIFKVLLGIIDFALRLFE